MCGASGSGGCDVCRSEPVEVSSQSVVKSLFVSLSRPLCQDSVEWREERGQQ